MMKMLIIKPGTKFGRLSVVKETERQFQKRCFLCECSCGETRVVSLSNLRTGHTKSCGCYEQEVKKTAKTKHGGCSTRLYEIWQGMKKRCMNPNAQAYKHYGERGISVCKNWLSFESFRDWAVSNGYMEVLTLERIDNNGDYEPSNCAWIPLNQQNSNKRSSRLISHNGKTKSLCLWAEELGINYQTLHGRLSRGMSPADAFGLR